jgi:hypothetical protein
MPKRLVQLSVLISCPSDMVAERKVVEAGLNEINQLLPETYGVLLETINWESDLVPGIGPDPQAVINSQIKGRYDIYIGLLGARFGAQTPRAGSGTEEEFKQAVSTYTTAPETMRVLFYFKLSSENLYRLDLEQFSKVKEFRKSLKSSVLYHEFSDADSLLKAIKDHLRRLVSEQWDGNKWKVLTPLIAQVVPEETVGTKLLDARESTNADEECDEEDRTAAILDVIVSAETGFQTALEALNNIIALMEKLTSDVTSRTVGFPKNPTAREMKVAVDGAADDLAEYANGLKKELPIFTVNLNGALSGFDTALELYVSEKMGPPEQLATVLKQLTQLVSGMLEGRAGIDNFRSTIEGIPSYTVKFKKSKRTVIRLLADLSAGVTVFLEKLKSLQARISTEPDIVIDHPRH